MAANSHFLSISAVGTDEPGIIAEITQVLYELECNLADTTMSVLNGHFAMVLMVEAPATLSVEKVESALGRVTKHFQLLITAHELTDDQLPRYFAVEVAAAPASAMVTVYGADRPGIVNHVTSAIAKTGSNIIDLRTKRFNSSNALYSLFMDVQLAPGQSRDSLAAALGAVARRCSVEVQVQDVVHVDGL